MLFVWTFTEVVLKQQERNHRWAEHGTNEDHKTHTHTLNVECTKQQQHFVAVDQLLKTAAPKSLQQTLTGRSSHPNSACIHYATLFGEW
jgi:hypothetical protein